MVQEKKLSKPQPPGTILHTVDFSETLQSIAAHYDITPSELATLNRLSSRTIFPGQKLFVPGEDYVSAQTISPTEQSPTHKSDPFERREKDVPMITMQPKPPSKGPGTAERLSPSSPVPPQPILASPPPETKEPSDDVASMSPKISPILDASDFQRPPLHRHLTDSEAKSLIDECLEKFVKVRVKYITDGQGVIDGTLLVTPNALMFDPNVSDPLVIEKGADAFGVIAPMDTIISATLYHDIAAMTRKHHLNDPEKHKHEVYYGSEAKKDFIESSSPKLDSFDVIPSEMVNELPSHYGKTDSKASKVLGRKIQNHNTPGSSNNTDLRNVTNCDLSQFEIVSDLVSDAGSGERYGASESGERKGAESENSISNKHSQVPESSVEPDSMLLEPESEPVNPSTIMTDLQSTDINRIADTKVLSTEQIIDTEIGVISNDSNFACDKMKESAFVNESASQWLHADLEVADIKETGDLEQKLDSSDVDRDISDNPGVDIPASKFSDAQFSKPKNVFTFDASSVGPRSSEQVQQESTSTGNHSPASLLGSSFSSIANSPHINTFVNYATGLFRSTSDDRSLVRDITEVASKITKIPGAIQTGGSNLISSLEEMVTPANAELIHPKPSPTVKLKRSEEAAHKQHSDVHHIENAVKICDMPELFQCLGDIIPKRASSHYNPPLYLNIRVGHPINKRPRTSSVIESYAHNKKKPEYWFSIPREKVDQVYAFFVQWTPEKYGDADDIDPAERGFYVVDADNEEDELLDIFTDYFGPSNSPRIQRDWEIVSHGELLRRQSTMDSESLPHPELLGTSVVLTDDDVCMICPFLPARAVSYTWTLVYSSDLHGFSLNTLYRKMLKLDCPVLLAVKDTDLNVFGALSSCPFKVSEHFYGTGESFLFRCTPEFKMFRWTGENNFFIKGNMSSLAIGAGSGIFGLWFDSDLFHGRSHPCETYANEVLSTCEDFVVQSIEAWAFIDT